MRKRNKSTKAKELTIRVSAAKLPTANPGEHDEELRRLRSAREDLNARRAAGLR